MCKGEWGEHRVQKSMQVQLCEGLHRKRRCKTCFRSAKLSAVVCRANVCLQEGEGGLDRVKTGVLVHNPGRGRRAGKPTDVKLLAGLRMLETSRFGNTVHSLSSMEKETTRQYFKSRCEDFVHM